LLSYHLGLWQPHPQSPSRSSTKPMTTIVEIRFQTSYKKHHCCEHDVLCELRWNWTTGNNSRTQRRCWTAFVRNCWRTKQEKWKTVVFMKTVWFNERGPRHRFTIDELTEPKSLRVFFREQKKKKLFSVCCKIQKSSKFR
jgi:hypothetical protein